MQVPFADLRQQYQAIKPEIDAAIAGVIAETAFVRGKYVNAFEADYARGYGVEHCVSCANGTDAIYIALKALGVGPGSEVITVANSWIATSEVITQAGAKPVFVDIEPDYYNIDAGKIEARVTARTKAIIPVHLFGQPADMTAIRDICTRRGLRLIEDCAQAHFSEYDFGAPKGGKRKVGTIGDIGTFSFYPGKNLGAYGDAGAIVTNDAALARSMRTFANHGSMSKHEHEIEGINSRLDGLQAAILSVKLRHIHDWTRRRQEAATIYDKLLAGLGGIVTPKIRPEGSHVFHLYVVRARDRDGLQKHLESRGIGTGVHYPKPLPFLKAYQYLGHKPEDFPVAYRYQREILSLPMFPEISREQVEYVVAEIRAFYGQT
ncbi:MAG: DegT/DnrJ/EryC1/StrS family aminotransferase [Gammaproteobacteria bacterium]|nr:DegT/DnrJ/EryC1/StrS family aminotransferase [Gammaproteobacteria bacterium]